MGFTVIGGQLVAFAVRNSPPFPWLRVVLVVTVVILFLVVPLLWAILVSVVLILAILVSEPLLAFALGFLAMIPVVYAILWTAQHTVGRDVILPTLFGSSLLIFGLSLSSRVSGANKHGILIRLALLGSSACLLLGGILSAIFWSAFTT